jgi:hypothetical protein
MIVVSSRAAAPTLPPMGPLAQLLSTLCAGAATIDQPEVQLTDLVCIFRTVRAHVALRAEDVPQAPCQDLFVAALLTQHSGLVADVVTHVLMRAVRASPLAAGLWHHRPACQGMECARRDSTGRSVHSSHLASC